MNPQDALKLARRFIELPPHKRPLFVQALEDEDIDFSLFPIPAQVDVAGRDELSYAQQRMWFLWQLDPHSTAYHLPMAVRLEGSLDEQALQRAFATVVARHETLRTGFVDHQGAVLQQVHECVEVPLTREDLSLLKGDEQQARLQALAQAQVRQPFDLARPPLLRVSLVKLADEVHSLLLTLHHIVADGWSMALLIDELVKAYDAACLGSEPVLWPLSIQYRDYALWQRSWLEGGAQEKQLAYWQSRLGQEPLPLDLPLDRPRPALPSFAGARVGMTLDPDLTRALHGLARDQQCTLFMVLLASFKCLLQRYGGQRHIRVGVPVANRHRAEVEPLIGCFINTQVMQTDIDPALDLAGLLARVRETALGAQAHQDLPYEQLVEALAPERHGAPSGLFQVMFNHQSQVADVSTMTTRSGLQLQRQDSARLSARFDLALDTHESAGCLHAHFTYACDVFAAATVERMAQDWLTLLQHMVAPQRTAIGDWPVGSREETAAPPMAARLPVHRLFEQAAQTHPQRTAVVAGGERIDYATLNRRADALAVRLEQQQVMADEPVALVAERSIEMVVGLLAVLKVGAAYLPLEPEQPAQRLSHILADANVRLLLAPRQWQADLPGQVTRLFIDDSEAAGPYQGPDVQPAHLAYVIYTSGTTGQPKGVGVSHGALAHYLWAVAERLPLQQVQNMAMVSTPAADLGHTILFGALSSGRTLHLLDKDRVLDAQAFADYVQHEQIDALKIVPSHLQALLVASDGAEVLPRHCLILGGEACPPALQAQLVVRAPALAVVNHYGPTETTVGVLTQALDGLLPVALGQPLGHSRSRLLGPGLQPAAEGVRAELYIAGPSLARGYQGAPGQTAERFVPDPFDDNGGRMYRTGDYVRRDARGDLHFHGRRDGQVKIRGHRVELAEVQARIQAIAGVATALVRMHDDGLMIAYVVADPDQGAGRTLEQHLRATLAGQVPDALVPSHWLYLDALPLTANGKVDMRALPGPDLSGAGPIWRAAQTPLQMALAEVWAQVLNVERVGLGDNFFALGGHSLLATQLVSRVRKQLGLDVALRAVFDCPDLGRFCEAVAGLAQDAGPDIQVLARSQPMPLSHAQQRQWLFWKIHPASAAYHTPLAVRLRGDLDHGALQAALDALVARHETLRSLFEEHDGTTLQRVMPVTSLPIVHEDWQQRHPSGLQAHLQQLIAEPFDLRHGPLIRARLLQLAADEYVLLLTLHHIVSDGWSMGVMVRECLARYNAHLAGQTEPAPALSIHYADYASWQRARLADGQLQTQLAFWKEQLENDFDVLELPADRLRPDVPSYRGGRLEIRLPAALTQGLNALAVSANATLFHVFLASFAVLLARVSGRDKVNIGVPMTNRDRIELEPLIGFFVNTVIVRAAVDPAQSFQALLGQLKETALQAQANKDLPFDALVEALQPQRSTSYNPLFQIMFNHLRDVGYKVGAHSAVGLEVEELELSEHTAQFDLALNTLERSDGVLAVFNYATDLFDHTRIEALAGQWQRILESLLAQHSQAVADLPLQDPLAYQAWVQRWSCDQPPIDSATLLHQRIASQARRTPDAIAVVGAGYSLSYRELDSRANRLAHCLTAAGVGPETRVGIALDRGAMVPVALLATLKAGAGYVPLDPSFPPQRLNHMLADSGLTVLLLEPESGRQLNVPPAVRCLTLDEEKPWFADYPATDPQVAVHAQNLAYVIYTSGSTGQPKGVAISHQALLNFVLSMAEQPGIGGQSRALSLTSLSFDIAGLEIYAPLLRGGCVVCLQPGQQRDPQALLQVIETHEVNVIQATPSTWKMLAVHCPAQGLAGKTLLCGGEALEEDLARWLLKQGGVVWNLYGPTETTIWSARQQVVAGAAIVLGQPIANTSLRVQDAGAGLQPPGIAGELAIGGAGLARGYFRQPALTAQRFVPDPFGAAGARLYRTGDLARYENDHALAYLGRLDHQVKIRGLRIELGEIEVRLRLCMGVTQALVIALDGPQGKQLVAYVALDPMHQGPMPLHEWKAQLRVDLAAHMIPQHFVQIRAWPQTPNGKLDRRALPVPDLRAIEGPFRAPQSELEQRLATLWAQILGVERVGLDDNFFELGGHSLLATQVNAQAQAELGLDLPLILLFQAPSLQAYAEAVQACRPAEQDDFDELRDFLTDLETV